MTGPQPPYGSQQQDSGQPQQPPPPQVWSQPGQRDQFNEGGWFGEPAQPPPNLPADTPGPRPAVFEQPGAPSRPEEPEQPVADIEQPTTKTGRPEATQVISSALEPEPSAGKEPGGFADATQVVSAGTSGGQPTGADYAGPQDYAAQQDHAGHQGGSDATQVVSAAPGGPHDPGTGAPYGPPPESPPWPAPPPGGGFPPPPGPPPGSRPPAPPGGFPPPPTPDMAGWHNNQGSAQPGGWPGAGPPPSHQPPPPPPQWAGPPPTHQPPPQQWGAPPPPLQQPQQQWSAQQSPQQWGGPPPAGQQYGGPQPYGQPGQQPYGQPAPPAGYGSYGQAIRPEQLAEWGPRALGGLIDYFAGFAFAYLVVIIGIVAQSALLTLLGWVLLLGAVGFALYNAYQGGATGQSIGKRLAKIKLVKLETGQPIGGGNGILRYFVHAIEVGIGWFAPLFTAKKQTFADMVLGTVVIKAE